jgi:hypothetical protein
MADRSALILEEIDFLLAERRELAAQGPHFRIIHNTRGQWAGDPHRAGCLPGEDLLGIVLIYRGREYQLPLSPAEASLFDFLGRFRIGQTASQIERGIRGDAFYMAQYARAWKSNRRTAEFHRTTIKAYVKRIRLAMAQAFADAGLLLDPVRVMVSQPTVRNEKAYSVRARIQWLHVPGFVGPSRM